MKGKPIVPLGRTAIKKKPVYQTVCDVKKLYDIWKNDMGNEFIN